MTESKKPRQSTRPSSFSFILPARRSRGEGGSAQRRISPNFTSHFALPGTWNAFLQFWNVFSARLHPKPHNPISLLILHHGIPNLQRSTAHLAILNIGLFTISRFQNHRNLLPTARTLKPVLNHSTSPKMPNRSARIHPTFQSGCLRRSRSTGYIGYRSSSAPAG